MANPNNKPRDPILQQPIAAGTGGSGGGNQGGKMNNASKGRVIPKGSSLGSANFTGNPGGKLGGGGMPVPDSPYGKD